MTPTPLNVPVVEDGLLADLLSVWDANGWDRDVLAGFRMAVDDDEEVEEDDEDLDDEEEEDEEEEDDDRAARRRSAEARLSKANKEAATRRRELKPWKALGRELKMTPEEIRAALGKTKPAEKPKGDEDDKPDLETLRRDMERETTAKANRRIVRSEVKALAADLFADPADAPLYLDLDDYDVDDEGEVDEDQIREDLKALLKRKPHLAKGDGSTNGDEKNGRRRPKPDRAQGSRGKPVTGAEAGKAEAERRFGKSAAGAAAK